MVFLKILPLLIPLIIFLIPIIAKGYLKYLFTNKKSNKDDLMKDIYRVLKPGGLVVVSDWMRIDDNPPSKQMQEYIAAEGLDMYMYSLKCYEQALKNAGFIDIAIKDRNAWYLGKAKKELAAIEGQLNKQVIDAIGPEETAGAIDIWKKLIGVLELGEHRPGHFKAVKKTNS